MVSDNDFMKYLILGNGAAGTTAADKLHDLNKNGKIKLISSDDSVAYAKIMLPDYIGGKISRERLFLRNEDYYKNKGIELLKGRKAIKICTEKHYIELDNNTVEYYDKLLIATGSIPFVPYICGLDTIEYYTINSLKDADIIKGKAKKDQTAIVLGGGLTGIEMCFALARLGVKPYLVEKNECILPSQLNEAGTEIMKTWLNKDGIEILTGKSLEKISSKKEEFSEKKEAFFSGGQVLKFDLLICAVGTRPNISLVKESIISVNRGILVDKCMNTNIEGIYAAGDVCELESGQVPGYVSTYIWPNAMAQGKCAAYNMCGQESDLSSNGSSINPTQLRDMPFYSMGLVKPKEQNDYEVLEHEDSNQKIYKKIVLKENAIKGFILIGDTSSARELTSFLKNNTNISDVKEKLY